MFENNFPSLADISAVTKDNDGFGGSAWIWVILIFFIFGFGGNWGNRNGESYATPTQVYDATNQQSMFNSLNAIKEAVNAGTYENARLIDNVNYNNSQNTQNVIASVNQLSSHLDECCCNLRAQMLQDKYDSAMYQLNQANTAVANAVQTQNILNSLGRFVTNPPCYYNHGTTIA